MGPKIRCQVESSALEALPLQASLRSVTPAAPRASPTGASPSTQSKGTIPLPSYDPSSQASEYRFSNSVEAISSVTDSVHIESSSNSPKSAPSLTGAAWDTIFVPAAGTVSTVCWVSRITNDTDKHANLSGVIGASPASGCTLFAANEHQVQIVRTDNGERAVNTVDAPSY